MGRTSRRHPKGQPLIEPILKVFQIEIDKTGVGSGMTKPDDTAKDTTTKRDDQPDVLKAKDLDATSQLIVSIFPAGQTTDDVNLKGSMTKQNLFLFAGHTTCIDNEVMRQTIGGGSGH